MSAATDQAGRYMCHCGKGFLRKEHLRRHQATHAQPSFVCPVCDRSFTRSDVLRRHVAVHDSASVSPVRNWKACDACHENKTRCDGGEQCTLCNKRGIPCTYSRDGVKNAEVTAAAPDSTSSSGQSQDDQPDPMQIEPQLAADSHQPESLPTVTQDRQSKGDFQAARVGLTCVMDAISAEITGKKAAPSSSEHIQKWLPSCVSVYFGRFHERWTLVHAPVFDANTDSALLVGTVLIIASWQRDHKSLRGLIISIHDRLMAYLFRKLAVPVEDSEKPWLFEVYQIALLNITFAFESGRAKLIPRARRLLGLLIAALRDNHAFNPDAIERHAITHFPGTFLPWIDQHRTRWRWLAFNVLKIDTYMALLCNQPPVLHVEELELGLTSTFSLYNAYGIDKFFLRRRQEPPDRIQCSMANMARYPRTMLSSGTLVDDVALGFYGTYLRIWKWAQTRRINPFGMVDSEQGESVSHQLETWKIRLDSISNLWAEPEANAAVINYFLCAYRSEEEPIDAGWEGPVLDRIAAQILNVTILYHLLALHLNADIRSMTAMATGSWDMVGGPAPPEAVNSCAIRQWALSQEARVALVHSISILKAYENALVTMDSPCQSLDPIAHVALSTAGVVLRCWFCETSCDCKDRHQPFPDMGESLAKDHWVQNGGPISVGSVTLCRCLKNTWMTRFVSTLSQGAKSWDASGSIVEALQKEFSAI